MELGMPVKSQPKPNMEGRLTKSSFLEVNLKALDKGYYGIRVSVSTYALNSSKEMKGWTGYRSASPQSHIDRTIVRP
jgi:hypothetical protein